MGIESVHRENKRKNYLVYLFPYRFVNLCYLFVTLTIGYAEDREAEFVSVDIGMISVGKTIKDVFYNSGGEKVSCNIYPNVTVPDLRYEGPSQIVFYKSQTGGQGDLELGTVKIPPNSSSVILLFLGDSKNSNNYNILCFPHDKGTFPLGTYRFINLTKNTIFLQLGETKLAIEAGKYKNLVGVFTNNSYHQALMVSLTEDGLTPAYANQIYYNERLRVMYLILPTDNTHNGLVKLVGVPDN